MTASEEVPIEAVPADLSGGMYRLRSDVPTTSVRRQLEDVGWAVVLVDLVWASDKTALMTAFATHLELPDWFGHNWDALEDALRDLAWWPPGERGRVIILRGADRVTTATPADREVLNDILRSATGAWAKTETPLVVLSRR